MPIVQTMTRENVRDELLTDENAKWSTSAANALAEYYENLSDDIGQNINFDRVAIRCEWSEYTFEELARNYSDAIDIDYKEEFWNMRNGGEFPTEYYLANLRLETEVIPCEQESETTYLVREF